MKVCFRKDILMRVLLVMWGIGHLLVLVLAVAMQEEGILTSGWGILVLLSVFWTLFTVWIAVLDPEVTLSDDGINVHRLFKKRMISWADIIQAGVLWQPGGSVPPNKFVLLERGGSPRKYRDKTFVFRNKMHLFFIPNTPEVHRLVNKHYGPLDFDLSDGKPEQSIVAD